MSDIEKIDKKLNEWSINNQTLFPNKYARDLIFVVIGDNRKLIYYIQYKSDPVESFATISKKEFQNNVLFNKRTSKYGSMKGKFEYVCDLLHIPKKEIDDLFNGFMKKLQKLLTSLPLESESEKGDIIIIDFHIKDILLTDNGIFLRTYTEKNYRDNLVGYLNFEFLFKTRDIRKDNMELYSFIVNNEERNMNLSVPMIIKKLERYIYQGQTGKDVIKHIFNKLHTEMEYRKPKYILGFDNGWVLPMNENKEKYTIINYTQFQKECYENAKDMYRNYKLKEKREIRKILSEFIERTQMPMTKQSNIIGWSISSLFRSQFIKYFHYFPIDCESGAINTGKTTLMDFYAIQFYKIHKKHYSSSTFNSTARAEDYMATAGFPLLIDEAHNLNEKILELFKESTTGGSDYIRKENVLEALIKPKVASIGLTCNEVPEVLIEKPMTSKMINIDHKENEKIIRDAIWLKLQKDLLKERLFSLIYDKTKKWNDNTVIDLIKRIEREVNKKFDSLFSKGEDRIRKTLIILLFGMRLFKICFGIDLESEIYKILNLLKLGKISMTLPIFEQFLEFCSIASDFDAEGKNPKYLTAPIQLNINNDWYFTNKNLRDFNEFAKAKYNYKLKTLWNLLQLALKPEFKKYIQYDVRKINKIPMKIIIIKKQLREKYSSDDLIEIKKEQKKLIP